MKGSTDFDKCVDILRTVYLRMMRLRFTYQWVSAICDSPKLISECPDMCYCMKWSFTVDAFITIDALFSNGTYAFSQLCSYDAHIKSIKGCAYSRVNEIVPNFHSIRNRMFAHFIDKQDGLFVSDMMSKFEELFVEIMRAHGRCCDIFGISCDDIGGYGSDVFEGMSEQIDSFLDMLL